jgi:hypothetical protein
MEKHHNSWIAMEKHYDSSKSRAVGSTTTLVEGLAKTTLRVTAASIPQSRYRGSTQGDGEHRDVAASILEAVVDRGRAVDLLSWLQGGAVLLGGRSRDSLRRRLQRG